MNFIIEKYLNKLDWRCKTTWVKSTKNTLWCLLGCSIGDLGTIAYFQYNNIDWPLVSIMLLAICNGIITSVILETLVLLKQMKPSQAFRTAIGMSLVSMVSMEIAMNITDIMITGGAYLTWWVIPFMLLAGFMVALPYNYYRLKLFGLSCH